MALGDWVFNTSTDPWVTSLDVTNPLVDLGSLSAVNNVTAAAGAFNAYLNAPFEKGFTKGKVRSLVGFDVTGGLAANHFNHHAGVVCMQSHLDISQTTGSAYVFGFGSHGSVGWRWGVWKHVSAGLAHTSATIILAGNTSISGGVTTAYDFWPMELEWNVDIPGLGGTRLIARIGTKNSEDFGTLADVYDAVDSSTPLTVSVAEGVFGRKGDTDTTPYQWSFDTTSIFELV